MIRFLDRQIRHLVAPDYFVWGAVTFYLVIEAMNAWLVWWWGLPNFVELARVRVAVVIPVTAMFGFLRGACWHPLYWTGYGRWLARTPWTIAKPLPLPAIQLTPRDCVAVGLLVLAHHHTEINRLYVPLLFLVGYLATLALSMPATGARANAYAIAFGLGLVLRLIGSPVDALFVAVLLYPIAIWGVRRSLAGFPWSNARLLASQETPGWHKWKNCWE